MSFPEELRAARLVAIVRGTDPAAALASTLVLAEEGVRFIEVSLTTDGALDVISRARAALGPGAWLGAGTVLSAADARAIGRAYAVTLGAAGGRRMQGRLLCMSAPYGVTYLVASWEPWAD